MDGETVNTIRVFPRRTSYTPVDDMAFVGYPPMIRPEAHQVQISCCFTWDMPKARELQQAWSQYYPNVIVGGPASGLSDGRQFTPGLYVRQGITFTSRGCNNHCPWCLVPQREDKLKELPVVAGYDVGDNNLLQCSQRHLDEVFYMLRGLHRGVRFSGGLDSRLITDRIADDIRGLNINEVFLACDTKSSISPLREAAKRLHLPRSKTRCYVLLAYNGESISDATARLGDVWAAGCLPFAQLYQPPTEKRITYSQEWRDLARTWSRPAAMMASHKERHEKANP